MSNALKYAVMGNPIEHSLSPKIHLLFAEQTHQNISYEKILVPTHGLKEAIQQFRNQGGLGVNITVPFKTEAWQLAQQHSECANIAQAANVLIFKEHGEIYADNTDGLGLLNDLEQNLNIELKNKRILILGAGGAARGILYPLLLRKPQCCVIANRTLSKAEKIATDFSRYGSIQVAEFNDLTQQTFDLIINATSAGLESQKLPLPSSLSIEHGCCYDLAYGKAAKSFLQWGGQHGAKLYIDGLGMLIEQAALSFELWRKVKPNSKSVYESLRKRKI